MGTVRSQDLDAVRVRRIQVADFAESAVDATRPTVFVLGREAADGLRPEMVGQTFRDLRHWAVVVADGVDHLALARWRAADSLSVVAGAGLRARLLALHGPLRVRLRPEEWMPPHVTSPGALLVARHLDGLPHPGVGALAAALGRTEKNQLARHVARVFHGWTPRHVVAEFLRALVARERGFRDRTGDEIAAALGYHDWSTLRRALGDRVGARRATAPLLPFPGPWRRISRASARSDDVRAAPGR